MGTAGQIYAALKAQLGTAYTVLEAYDAMEAIDPSGTIALNITEMEPMHHTGCDDWRFSVAVSGFTLADADRDRSIMQAMSEHVMRSIDADALKAAIDCCAGVVIGAYSANSDGDSNEFTLGISIYVAPATWDAVDASSNSGDSSNQQQQ